MTEFDMSTFLYNSTEKERPEFNVIDQSNHYKAKNKNIKTQNPLKN